jgi:UPF0271 protein
MSASEKSRPVFPRAFIDLNADLGEGCPNDRALLELVTSASIGCGAHAGSLEGISRTLCDARECGVVVGAHPGYPDREHFGRREREMSSAAVKDLILEQVSTLSELAIEAGVTVRFLKPHGALYNQAQRQSEIAHGVVAAAVALGIPLLGQPGTPLEGLASAEGVRYIAEGFPDRRYRDDGSLVPRSQPDALLRNPAEMEAGVLRLVEDSVATLCIHGDDPKAVENAKLVRGVLEAYGVRIQSFLIDVASDSDGSRKDPGT